MTLTTNTKTKSGRMLNSSLSRTATLALFAVMATSACGQNNPVSATVEPATVEPATVETATIEREVEAPASQAANQPVVIAEGNPAEDQVDDNPVDEDPIDQDPVDEDPVDEDPVDDGATEVSSTGWPSTCFTNGTDLLVLDFGAGEIDPFTGVAAIGNSVAAVTGVRIDPGNPDAVTYLVNSTAIGSAEEGSPVVDQQLWYGFEGISIKGSFFSEILCDDVTDRRDESLTAQLGGNHPPVPTVATTIRSCYVHADEIMVLDFDPGYWIYLGFRTNLDSIEAVSAGNTIRMSPNGETVLRVKSSPVGSAEEDGGPIIYQQEWLKSDFRAEILIGDQTFTEVADCDSLGDRVQQLDQLVDFYPPIIE